MPTRVIATPTKNSQHRKMEVQRALEDSLPELEALLEHDLLSEEEVRTLVVRRREYESRLRRFELLKQDALEYIGFEMNLHRLVEKRKARRNVRHISSQQYNAKKTFEHKINVLFDLLIKKFKGDLDLWVAAIEFAQSVQNDTRVSLLCGNGIRMFPTKDMFWVLAAKHELERNANVSQARQVLITALKSLPDNETVWLEYFRMEFLFVNQVLERRVVQGLEITNHHDDLLKTVFANAIQAVPNKAEFQLQFVRICDLFADKPTGQLVREHVLDSLQHEFPENRQIMYELLQHPARASKLEKSAVWYELQVQIALEDGNEDQASKLCEQAMKDNLFTEHMAVQMSNTGEGKKKRQRLEKFTERFPHSVELWEMRCELDETALAQSKMEESQVTLKMWRLELERHPNNVLSILQRVKNVEDKESLISYALQVTTTPSQMIVDLEHKVISIVPESCFEALWEGGSVTECAEKRRVLELWVKRHPSQRAFQILIEFERQEGGKDIKPLLLRAMGSVSGFKLE